MHAVASLESHFIFKIGLKLTNNEVVCSGKNIFPFNLTRITFRVQNFIALIENLIGQTRDKVTENFFCSPRVQKSTELPRGS